MWWGAAIVRVSLNEVTLIGNLESDPEYYRSERGQAARCILSVATYEEWRDRSGEGKSHTEWHRVVVWGGQADACGSYLQRGRLVWIRGRIRTRVYERDGQERTTYEVFATRVQFLGHGTPSQQQHGDAEVA